MVPSAWHAVHCVWLRVHASAPGFSGAEAARSSLEQKAREHQSVHSSSRHAAQRRTERARATQLGGTHALPSLLRLWPAGVPSLAATMRARVSSDTAPPNCASLRVLSAADILARVSSLCRPLDRRGLRSAWPDTSAVSAAPAPGSSDWRPSPACSVCGPAATLAAAGRTLRSLPPGKRGRWSSRQWHMFGTGSAGCVWGKVSAAHLHAYPLRPTAHEGVGGRQALPNMHPRRSRCGAAARSDKRVGLCCVQMFELRRLGVAA